MRVGKRWPIRSWGRRRGGNEPGRGAEAGAAFSRQPGSAGGASGVVCEWGLAGGGLSSRSKDIGSPNLAARNESASSTQTRDEPWFDPRRSATPVS